MAVDFEMIKSALIERHGEEVYNTLKNARVAVAGLGGLGSNIAMMLVRAGVGRLLLVDFDEVDITNLNRQNYYIKHLGKKKTEAARELMWQINPYADIEIKTLRVTAENVSEVFSGYELVCEAFDRPENKALLVNAMLEEGKTVVCGSGMAGYLGANSITTKRLSDNFYICGDRVTDSGDTNGLMSPRVTVCAAHQANMIIRLLLGERDTD
ncbi:MAG: sulfur carrier protein ThiS adenylyltransferase ThiF [Clostridiales bacterium]|nr:sulfur carrier protein ThiS adenylyltransferase ThiF [Clostridiales bacterium]